MTLYPSPDLPEFLNAVLRWRRDYEQMCRDIVEEKKSPWIDRWTTLRALTAGKRGAAFPEGSVDNPEPDDKTAVPITEAEAYRAMAAINGVNSDGNGTVNTLRDMGIYTTTRWRLAGRCRFHGEQVVTIETNEEMPENVSMKCFGCLGNDVTRWIEITERKKLEGDA